MSRWRSVFRGISRVYGDHPLHLLTMAAGFALLGYVVVTVKPMTLWNPHSWWQSIAVWFAAAIIGHDLLLFPIYALADRILWAGAGRRPRRQPSVSVRNYIRVPALGSGLTLLVFLPGIIRQGASTYLAATGQTQQPFLGRWLLLSTAMFMTSVVVYLVRFTTSAPRSSRVSSLMGGPRGTLPK